MSYGTTHLEVWFLELLTMGETACQERDSTGCKRSAMSLAELVGSSHAPTASWPSRTAGMRWWILENEGHDSTVMMV